MGVACPRCGSEDLKLDPISRFRLGIPHLSELQQAVILLSCPPCRRQFEFLIQERNRPSFLLRFARRSAGLQPGELKAPDAGALIVLHLPHVGHQRHIPPRHRHR